MFRNRHARRGIPVVVIALAAGLSVLGLGGVRRPSPGDPLPGLSRAQLAVFTAGKIAFNTDEDAGEGLGPVFTDTSCGRCHNTPAIGGGSDRVVTRIGRWVNGAFDPLLDFGGPLIQNRAIGPDTGYLGPFDFIGEVVPPEATVKADRRTTPLFGLGFVEALPDDAIRMLAASQQQRDPSTAGRPHIVTNLLTGQQAVGRFGWKAQVATLLDFAADAYANEMGVTTTLAPFENCPQGNCAALAFSPLPVDVPNDPENDDLELFRDFMRLLAPLPPGPIGKLERAGSQIFSSIGCAVCHVPTWRTGPNAIAALDRVPFSAYSDFLLHDMGSLGDGIVQGDAGPREMRTAPLWGLRAQPRLLHDGRAASVEEAIRAHDGQALAARLRYQKLRRDDQKALLAFLNSL